MDLIRSDNLKEFSGKREREEREREKHLCRKRRAGLPEEIVDIGRRNSWSNCVVQECDDVILLGRIPTPSRIASNTSREETSRGRIQQCEEKTGFKKRWKTNENQVQLDRLENIEKFLQQTSEYPDSAQIINLATSLGHDRYVIRVWFYNNRQNLKGKTGVRKRKKRVESHQAKRVEDLSVDEF